MSYEDDGFFADQNDSGGYESVESKVSYDQSGSEKKSSDGELSDEENQNSKYLFDNLEVDDDYFQEDLDQIEEEQPEWRQKYDFSKTKTSTMRKFRQLQDGQRWTLNVINKLEFVKIIGLRAKQISNNSSLYVNLSQNDEKNSNCIEMAKKEFFEKSIPFVIEREHPSGEFERWSFEQLNK